MHISWVLVLFLKKERKIMLMHPLTLINGFPSPHKGTPIALAFPFSNYHCITKEKLPPAGFVRAQAFVINLLERHLNGNQFSLSLSVSF